MDVVFGTCEEVYGKHWLVLIPMGVLIPVGWC